MESVCLPVTRPESCRAMAQGSYKKNGGSVKVKGKAGKATVAAKTRRVVNKGKNAVKKGCE